MPIEFDITPAVKQHTAIPFERLTVIRHFDHLRLARVRRGIIYFFAGWSGLSISHFHRVTKSLASLTDVPYLEIYIVDIDCVPKDFMMSTFGHRHPAGSGETAWVRDGQIVSVVDIWLSDIDAEVSRRTRELFHETTA
jgi:hypothetical protein